MKEATECVGSVAWRRLGRGILLASVLLSTGALWVWYGPSPGEVGTPLRWACYGAFGGTGLLTLVHPVVGLVAMMFAVPLLSGVPIAITGGMTYPIVLLMGIGFVAGWLLREVWRPQRYEGFRGESWLWVFAVLAVVSGVASFLRYNPPWQWFLSAFNQQAVNVSGMARVDAVRFVVFVAANVLLGVVIVCVVRAIVSRYEGREYKVATLVIWGLLAGAAVSSAVAIYQVTRDINFCANRSYYWVRLTRANGLCSDPNALGTLLALCITLGATKCVFAGEGRSWATWLQRLIALVMVGLYALGLQYSGSRSGFLGMLIAVSAAVVGGVMYYGNVLLRWVRVPLLLRFACGLVFIAVCVAGLQRVPAALRYVDQRLGNVPTSSSLVRRFKRDLRLFQQEGNVWDMMKDPRRLLYWRYAKVMWKEFPFCGVGLGAYVIELPNYCAAADERLFRTDNACNYYLHYAAEMGTPALVALGLFYGTLLLGFVRGMEEWQVMSVGWRHHRVVLGVSLVTFMIVLVFGVHTMAEEVNVAFAVLLGLVAADHEVVLGKGLTLSWPIRAVVWGLVGLVVVVYALRLRAVNAGVLNGERRMAAFALGSDAGWHEWEYLDGVPFKVRWMGRVAQSVIPREGVEVGIPVLTSDPQVTNKPQVVKIYVNGELMRTHRLSAPNEWQLLRVTVPYANAFQYCGPFHAAIRVEVSRTWVPRKVTGWDDDRELGVLVGEPRWLEPEAPAGGWYEEETSPEGMRYRWSSRYAWQRLYNTTNSFLSIPMYAANIQLRRWPLRVAIFLNRAHLDTVTLTDKRWREYRYPLPNETPTNSDLLVELVPSRTWVPRHYGFDDYRELGVAVGRMRLE